MNEEIGSLLRTARRERKETQAAFARRLGLSQQLVSRAERGECSLSTLIRLSGGLGLPLSLQIADRTVTLVHALDPGERREIEANIEWYSRLKPADRLRVAARNFKATERLRRAARRGR